MGIFSTTYRKIMGSETELEKVAKEAAKLKVKRDALVEREIKPLSLAIQKMEKEIATLRTQPEQNNPSAADELFGTSKPSLQELVKARDAQVKKLKELDTAKDQLQKSIDTLVPEIDGLRKELYGNPNRESGHVEFNTSTGSLKRKGSM
ncbi:MAG: hypothetical protein ACHQAX_07140 [Gammaproteobacteria bacterium]